MPQPLNDAQILTAYHDNAASWTLAVRESRIASRALVTNRAILDAVMRYAPKTLLDVGCGEGWLARAVAEQGVSASGIDAVPELIRLAKEKGGARFDVMTYQDIAVQRREHLERYDVIVCNFALIGKDDVEGVLDALPAWLSAQGVLVIQTLHRVAACGDAPYIDGWREGSWAGFGEDFTTPAPWYFRTLASWIALLMKSGLTVVELQEPIHPETKKPASIIFGATLRSSQLT
jgi:2-polyprenyl-3-methyl-5-hydroxy-6-metoxy-1,4-benzoquinol methylase